MPLFPLPEGARRKPKSAQVKRTERQRFLIQTGFHPLSPVTPTRMLKLHPFASRRGVRMVGARDAVPRCGTCVFAGQLDEDGRTKRCWIKNGERVTRGQATELRDWWPACVDYQRRGEGATEG